MGHTWNNLKYLNWKGPKNHITCTFHSYNFYSTSQVQLDQLRVVNISKIKLVSNELLSGNWAAGHSKNLIKTSELMRDGLNPHSKSLSTKHDKAIVYMELSK